MPGWKQHFWVWARPLTWGKHLENTVLRGKIPKKTGILGLPEACFKAVLTLEMVNFSRF